MTLQAWCFSWRGRLRRRDFWVWLTLWLALMVVLYSLADRGWISRQTAAFGVVFLLWPTSAVVVKRLHDRNKSAWWALLLLVAWMMLARDWEMLPLHWQWALDRFLPALILVTMTLELGTFSGTQGMNRFGRTASPVNYFGRKLPDYQ